ncbi:MAG: transpeptidase family protein [Gemmatimonadota bacterium]|nr:MAG: transpeptidase family protein [Gemmatimonadota bacterium]
MAKPAVRLGAVRLAFAIAVAIILVRAAEVQLVKGARYSAAASSRTEERTQPAARGTIYDRNGEPLAQSVARYHVDVRSSQISDSVKTVIARLLVQDLGISRALVRRELREPYGYFHGPYTSIHVQRLRSVPGVDLRSSGLGRFYPNGSLAREVLGLVGADGKGASGLERRFDSILTGIPGSDVVRKDLGGGVYESPNRRGPLPVPGHDLFLTLDAGLQEIVENALDDALQQFDAESGDVVVLEPRTGEVLALASRTATGGETTAALTHPFEPGSTAKVFAAAALLLGGHARWNDSVWAERGVWHTEHRTIEDEKPYGYLTLRQVIERSSNIGIVKFARLLNSEEQYLMLRDFGLGSRTGIEFPSEAEGRLARPHTWSGISGESMALGYELSVTPLQLAQAYAAIANDGVMMRPTLVRTIVTAEGETVYRHVPEPVRRVVPSNLARELREALRGVVFEGGTGERAALEGYEVAGKTGTARRASEGGYLDGSYTTSFTSLFPAVDPQIVMVVKLDEPKDEAFAAATAAPITKAVLEQLLASETGALERARLAANTSPEPRDPPEHGAVTRVFLPWPPETAAGSTDESCAVPDVRGLSLRAAANELHVLGLRMRSTGRGTVRATDPAPGTIVPRGTWVQVTAGDRGSHR